MPKIAELLAKIVNPNIEFRVDPDESHDIQNEKHFVDIITPYEQDHKAEAFRPNLVAACIEVKGLDACLKLSQLKRYRILRARQAEEAKLKEAKKLGL